MIPAGTGKTSPHLFQKPERLHALSSHSLHSPQWNVSACTNLPQFVCMWVCFPPAFYGIWVIYTLVFMRKNTRLKKTEKTVTSGLCCAQFCEGLGFPGGARGQEPAFQCRRHNRCWFHPWVGKTPGGGHGNPLQYSCLENPTDRGAWQAAVHGVAKSQTRLSDWARMWRACNTWSVLCLWVTKELKDQGGGVVLEDHHGPQRQRVSQLGSLCPSGGGGCGGLLLPQSYCLHRTAAPTRLPLWSTIQGPVPVDTL